MTIDLRNKISQALGRAVAPSRAAPPLTLPPERQEPPDDLWQIDETFVADPPAGYAYEIAVTAFFSARHFVAIDGRPGAPHPHSYRVEARCRARALAPDAGIAVGFRELRDQVALVVAAYNETLLNDLPPFRRLQPTTEALTGVMHQQIARRVEPLGVELVSLTVWESPTQSVTLRRMA